MSDSLLQSLRNYSLERGDAPHDALADSARQYAATPHDRLAASARDPYALEPVRVETAPPLEPRTPEQLQALPPQPSDIQDPFSFMKGDLRSIWRKPQHGFVHKLWDSLAVPSHAIAHEIAKATHQPDVPGYDLKDQVSQTIQKGIGWNWGEHGPVENFLVGSASDAVGMAATFAVDPLTWTSIGPQAKAVEALRVLREPIAGGRNLMAAAAAGGGAEKAIGPAVRRGMELTRETIPEAAELMMKRNLDAAMGRERELMASANRPEWAVKMEADLLAKGTPAEQVPGMLEEALNTTHHGTYGKSYAPASPVEQAGWLSTLQAERQKIQRTPWGVSHPDIQKTQRATSWENYQGHADPMLATARQQALLEAEIEHGLPYLRIAGARTPIPSPFPMVGAAARRASGKWQGNDSFERPVGHYEAEMNAATPGSGDDFFKGVKAAFDDRVDRTGNALPSLMSDADIRAMPMGSVYVKLQSPAGRSIHSEFRNNMPVGILYGRPLEDWVSAQVAHIPDDAMRLQAVTNIRNAYAGLAHVLEKNVDPKAANLLKLHAPTSPQNMRESVQRLDQMILKPTMWPHDPAVKPWKQQTRDNFDNSFVELTNLINGGAAQVNRWNVAANTGDIGSLVGMVQDYNDAARTLHAGATEEKFSRFLTAYHDMATAQTPPEAMYDHLKDLMDFQKNGRQLRTTMTGFHKLNEAWRNHDYADAVNLTGTFDEPFWKGLVQQFSFAPHGVDPAKTAVQTAALEADLAKVATRAGPGLVADGFTADVNGLMNSIRKKFKDQADTYVNQGAMGVEQSKRIHALMDNIGNHDLYHFGNVMETLSDLKKAGKEATLTRLENLGLKGIQNHLQALANNESAAMQRLQLPFEKMLPYMQTIHDPTLLGKFLAEHVEPTINAVLRHAGWPQGLIQGGQRFESEWHHGKWSADKRADDAAKDLAEVAQRQGATWNMAQRSEADRAAVDIWGNERGRLDPLTRTLYEHRIASGTLPIDEANLLRRLVDIDTKATGLTVRGEAKLAELLGGNAAAVKPFMLDLKATTAAKHTDFLRHAELGEGAMTLHAKDYLPQMLSGNRADKDRFWSVLNTLKKGGQLGSWASNSQIATGGPVLSSLASYERSRGFSSVAEMELVVDEVNGILKSMGKRPLNLKANPSYVSRIGNRWLQHYRSNATRQFIQTLGHELPSEVLGFVPGGKSGGAFELGRVARSLGLEDVGETVPSMRGWHVNKKLHDWIKETAGFEEEPTGPGAVWRVLSKPLMDIQQYLKRLNTSFDLVQIKNVASNALVMGGPDVLKEASQIVGRATMEAAKSGGRRDWFSPMMPIARAMERDPAYQLGAKHGLFRSGYDYEMPFDDLIDMRMNPHTVRQGLWKWISRGTGPTDAMTFDVVDRSMRMALMNKYIRLGFTPSRAAEMANHKLVDYSMRYLTGGARRLAQSMMTFPSWTIGNIMTHVPNMIQNPAWYAAVAHASDLVSDEYNHHKNEDLPVALAGAFAMGHSVPGTNHQVWLRPGWPWQSVQNLMRQEADQIAKGNAVAAAYLPARFAAQQLVPMFTVPGELIAQRGGLKGMEKHGMWDTFTGDPKKEGDTGIIGEVLWGLEGYNIPNWIRALLHPSMWRKELPKATQQLRLPLPGMDVRGFVESQIGYPAAVESSGKVHY